MPAPRVNRERAVALHMAGTKPAAIAEMFGVKPPAITRALRDAGIVLRPGRAALRDSLADLVAEGVSLHSASVRLGVTHRYGNILWAEIKAGLGWQAV